MLMISQVYRSRCQSVVTYRLSEQLRVTPQCRLLVYTRASLYNGHWKIRTRLTTSSVGYMNDRISVGNRVRIVKYRFVKQGRREKISLSKPAKNEFVTFKTNGAWQYFMREK